MNFQIFHPLIASAVTIIKNQIVNSGFLLFIVFALLLFGCSTDEPEIEKVNYEFIGLNCLWEEDSQYIIESEEEYINMATQIYGPIWGTCADTTQAPFDFNYYVLLGRYTSTDSNNGLTFNLYKDRASHQIIYKINLTRVPGPATPGGFGDITSSGMNWVKVEKPPADYSIIIEYNEN